MGLIDVLLGANAFFSILLAVGSHQVLVRFGGRKKGALYLGVMRNLTEFIKLLWSDWLTLMSGSLSVFLFIATTFWIEESLHKSFAILIIFTGCFVAAFRVWLNERNSKNVLEDQFSSKIKIEFSVDTPGCKIPNVDMNVTVSGRSSKISCDFYRLKITNLGIVPLQDCSGRILSIRRGNTLIMEGENLELTFAPAERPDALRREIRHQVPEYLDVLAITEHQQILITTKNFAYPNSIPYDKLFSYPERYLFEIAVTAPNTKTNNILLEVNWTFDRRTTVVRAA